MKNQPEKLLLNESYIFDVTVRDGDNRFAGKLELSPKNIRLTINGDTYQARQCGDLFSNKDEIRCSAFPNIKFILKHLKLTRARHSTITNEIGHFEIEFKVGYIIYSPNQFNENEVFALEIYSSTISNWIGRTSTQRDIVETYINNAQHSELTEFIEEVDSHSQLAIIYNTTEFYAPHEFKAGINFIPVLYFRTNKSRNIDEIKSIFDKLYALFYYITGDELILDNLLIFSSYARKGISIYYPTDIGNHRNKHSSILFPLKTSKSIINESPGDFPLLAFREYFSLSEKTCSYFSKYMKYNRMSNQEEKFLGFFRILESLCYKSKNFLDEELLNGYLENIKNEMHNTFNDTKNVNSLLRGIKRLNRSKYNTEKCLIDYLTYILDQKESHWIFSSKDIASICKLRNDITHANNYYCSEEDIYSKLTFIETLLIFALGKEIGFNKNYVSDLIHRKSYSHLIK